MLRSESDGLHREKDGSSPWAGVQFIWESYALLNQFTKDNKHYILFTIEF